LALNPPETATETPEPPLPTVLPPENNVPLTPALGLKTDRLFDFPVFDETKRFQRLENAVQDLRDDMDKILPVMNTQLAVQGDLKALLDRLKTMVPQRPLQPMDAPAAVTNQPYAAAASPVSSQSAPPPASQPTVGFLANIRVADHPDKTRLVIETTTKAAFEAVIDGGGGLTITAAANHDRRSLQDVRLRSVRVRNLSTTDLPDGRYQLRLSLTNLGRIQNQFVIAPNKDSRYYRTVIDLAP
jgi:hypothetical protein